MSTRGRRVRQVLVVEDDPDHQTLMRVALDRTDRYTVVAVAATAWRAVAEASRVHPDVVLLDLHLRDSSGFDSLPEILVHVPTALVVAISADPAPSARRRAVRAGAFAFLAKSPDLYAGERLAVALDRLAVQFDAMLAGIDVCTPVFPAEPAGLVGPMGVGPAGAQDEPPDRHSGRRRERGGTSSTPRPAGAGQVPGRMFWLLWNRLCGS